MDEQQLRGLVREAIARHLGPTAPAPAVLAGVVAAPSDAIAVAVARFDLPRPPGEVDCVIEPSVTCTHCGHCLCYGH